MPSHFLKKLLKAVWFRDGTAHFILMGPMRGMRFRCSNSTGLAALYSGNEHALQKVFANIVQNGDTVLDAGANWGVHTLCLARLVGPQGSVLAFEPHPDVLEELNWHVNNNHLKQVVVHPCGLYNSEGFINFVKGEISQTSHMLHDAEESPGITTIKVPCRTLDSVVQESGISALQLIKIDVEGAESKVLDGAVQTIAQFRPHLIIELHTPEQDLEVARILTGWRYQIQRVEGPAILHLDRSWPDPHGVWGTIHAIPN